MLGTSKEKHDDESGVVETESGEYKEEDESDKAGGVRSVVAPAMDKGKKTDEMDEKSSQNVQKVSTLVLPPRKNKLVSEDDLGDGVRSQGRSGRGFTSTRSLMPMTIEKLGNVGTAKQLRSPRLSFDNTKRLALDKEWEKGRHILQGDDLVVSTIDKSNRDQVEEGPRTQESGQPKSSQEFEADDTNLQGPECLFPDTCQLETPEATMGQDVIMSDSEISGMIVTVKSVFMEHTEDYGIPQLERLYTQVIKGVFEAKASEPGDDDLRPSILRYFLKFGENTTNF
ncbi:hypothetical protein U1Q18_025853 [Sarracenia purpurea var. burkii]